MKVLDRRIKYEKERDSHLLPKQAWKVRVDQRIDCIKKYSHSAWLHVRFLLTQYLPPCLKSSASLSLLNATHVRCALQRIRHTSCEPPVNDELARSNVKLRGAAFFFSSPA